MKKRMFKITGCVLCMVMMAAMPVYAGDWKQDSSGWWYQNADGTYPAAAWEWIDGKCYFFNEEGYMLSNGTAPDGSVVNGEGAWTVDGVVQTKDAGGGVGMGGEVLYPLKDDLWGWFGSDDELGGKTIWKWDSWHIPWDLNEEVKSLGRGQYIMNCAIRDKNPMYLISYGNLNLAVLAELTGYPQTGLEYVDQEKKIRMVQEVNAFLNSFDWRNSGDYEKAVRIVNWITMADYDYNNAEESHFPYGCLVNKSAVCEGYTDAAKLLGTCIGIPVLSMGDISHSYPVFLVNNIWLAYEPTSKDNFFTVADVYETSYTLNGQNYLFTVGEYCQGIAYEVPKFVSSTFPDVRNGWFKGKNAELIYFK